jgi:Uma2 family endonuclease
MGATLVSMQEHLHTSYSPDREFVDGVVAERNVGERPHSRVQSNLITGFYRHHPQLDVWPGQRILTTPTRARIPDICVTTDDPGVDVFQTPPLICVEILSLDDRVQDLLERLRESATMGVPHLWVIDPRARQAFTYSDSSLKVVNGPVLTAGEISIPLEEVFHRL